MPFFWTISGVSCSSHASTTPVPASRRCLAGLWTQFREVAGRPLLHAVTAALREATEETGISKRLQEGAHIIPVGHRSYNRPFDIRVAWGDMPGTDIKKGDLFAVSTQAFCVKTTQDLSRVSLKAGDGAKGVLVATISSVTPDEFGVADHLAMIQAAQVAAREGP
jgi:hypothetical protein